MPTKTNRWIRLAIALVLGATIAGGVILKIALIPLIAIPAAWLATMLLGRLVTDRVRDERLIRLANAAARWSFSIFGLATSAGGAILVALYDDSNPMWAVGMTLSLSVAFLTLLYAGLYFVFTKKY